MAAAAASSTISRRRRDCCATSPRIWSKSTASTTIAACSGGRGGAGNEAEPGSNEGALVGQRVSYVGADGATVTGLAESISFATSPPTVNVGGKAVALDAVSGVAPSTTSTTDAASGAATA